MVNPRVPETNQKWVPYVGLAIFILGIVYQASSIASRVDSNSNRITALEISDRAKTDKMDLINQRGARIEAKIDLMVPPRENDDDRK